MSEARYAYTVPVRDLEQLHQELAVLFSGFLGLCGSGPQVEALFSGPLEPAEQAQLDSAMLGHSPHPDAPALRLRAQARVLLDRAEPQAALIRALLLVLLDELNVLRQNPAAVLPPRSAMQLRTALRAKLDSGQAD